MASIERKRRRSLRIQSPTALGRKLERTARFVMQIGLPFSSTNDKKKSSNTKLYGLRQDPERTVRFAMQNGLSLSSTNDKKKNREDFRVRWTGAVERGVGGMFESGEGGVCGPDGPGKQKLERQ